MYIVFVYGVLGYWSTVDIQPLTLRTFWKLLSEIVAAVKGVGFLLDFTFSLRYHDPRDAIYIYHR